MARSTRAVALTVGVATAAIGLSRAAHAAQLSPAYGGNSASASSWVAGAHGGYNWLQGTTLYGFETDFSGTDLNSAMTGGLSYRSGITPPATDGASTAATIDWYGTFRGRIGTTTGPFLLFATAGLAYGNVDLNSAFNTSGRSLTQQTSTTRVGWVAGAGFEYLWRPDFSLVFNYQYVDLGNVSLAGSTGTFSSIGQSATAHAQFHAITVGFSWHFAPTGSSSGPWQGGYVGGQAGGDIGNRTNATYTSFLPPT